ncbi:MAG: DUF2339 domain-containing protein [Hyphomicrobiales bacterium]|nr:DUF2339 domain-containing protein [Hyphomicrobiales bacterium]
MEWILILILIGLFIVISAILPWINRANILEMKAEIQNIRQALGLETTATPLKPAETINIPGWGQPPELGAASKTMADEAETFIRNVETGQRPEEEGTASPTPKPAAPNEKRFRFEEQFGKRLPVWVGGIALAFAGFFLVKYTIDAGLLTPAVRVVLGLIFGTGLLLGARWIRTHEGIADYIRISQALAGAGIAVWYIAVYAAAQLYGLVSPTVGFLGMAITTAVAVILSLLHGAPIALLGLTGGFLTPALLATEHPSLPLLLIYLFFVFSGLMIVIRKQQWWWIALLDVIGALFWVALWLFSGASPDDTIWLGLFLLATSAVIVIGTREKAPLDRSELPWYRQYTLKDTINVISIAGSLALMGVIAKQAGLGPMQWGMYGLLTVGAILLAWLDARRYGFSPWLSLAISLVLCASWHMPDYTFFALVVISFALLHMVAGAILMWRSTVPLLWAGLSAASALGFYLLAYFRLHRWPVMAETPYSWGLLALVLAGLAVAAVAAILKRSEDSLLRQRLLAIFAGTATAFISLALAIELEHEFLSVAFAGEMTALAWLSGRLPIPALRKLAGLMALLFGFLLLPQLILLFKLVLHSTVGMRVGSIRQTIPIMVLPALQLGIPSVLFLFSAWLLHFRQDNRLVYWLELSAIALFATMGYYLMRHALHTEDIILYNDSSINHPPQTLYASSNNMILYRQVGFIERGILTNLFFVFGLLCLWAGNRWKRSSFTRAGLVLPLVALFRIFWFDLFTHNPLMRYQDVGAWPILNGVQLTYTLPILWAFLFLRLGTPLEHTRLRTLVMGCIGLLIFVAVNMNVRHFFHGAHLSTGLMSNAETYTYSAIWLILGIITLLAGMWRQQQKLRIASLVIILLTVGKVFLYDAGALDGLYRVFSFLGLGISLIGLSWLYTRFVFTSEEKQ